MNPDAMLPGMDAAVIGGGPAGLRAAEVLANCGARVCVFDHKPSVGRKFLVAGRGGLNLTHSESLQKFTTRYRGGGLELWKTLLEDFAPEALREWARSLGVETFVGTSGRVFPENKQAAMLLRRWVERLRGLGVTFQMRTQWLGFSGPDGLRLSVDGNETHMKSAATVLAMGGGSWPQTGSCGGWVTTLRDMGVDVKDLKPANCGFEVDWPAGFPGAIEGKPLKNIAVTAEGRRVEGELLITRYGLEGGALYQLSAELRDNPHLHIDFKPAWTSDKLRTLPRSSWRLGAVADSFLAAYADSVSPEDVKHFPLTLRGPRPLAEAISSAGGVRWDALNEDLMLKAFPGVFVAGEMIDWEAPTGGYLLQGCFATGTRAGNSAARWINR